MKSQIANLLRKTLKVKLSKEEIENYIEIPPSSEMGDYSFPCFFLSKKLKKNPNEIAIEIKQNMGSLPKDFEKIQTVGGYVNFFVDKENFIRNILEEILKQKGEFGKKNIGKEKKVLIEHTSINPNASPHVGRSRNAIIGDSLVQILKFLEFKPEVHYYVNDVSKQIAMLVYADAEKLKFEVMLKKYIEVSKKVNSSKKAEREVFELLSKLENQDSLTKKKFSKVTKTCVGGQKKILSEIGINYDKFDYESDYVKESKTILEKLKKTKKIFKDKEGRFILDLKGTEIENKMKSPVLILTRHDGTGLYPLRDIAYTIYKIKRSKENIIVLGEDQKLYFEQISYALKLLDYSSPRVVHYSFILLSDRGKSKKMSTRKGDVVLLEDFLKEAKNKAMKKGNKDVAGKISVGAIKYSILRNNPNKSINFNLDESLSFEGNTGAYLLYSYARASSILKKSKKQKKSFEIKNPEKIEIELVKKLSQFPEIVLNSYENLNPSLIANYSYELAQIFNEFYHSSKVIGSDEEQFRLSLVNSFGIVLKNSLNLLGIDVVDKM